MNAFKELRRIIEEMGGAWQIAGELEQFKQDSLYISEHWGELLSQYSNKWIAVLQSKVIASADRLSDLMSAVPERDRVFTAVKFMDTDPKPLILMAV
ncbi:MAG: hypothetical protein HYS60_02095 [Candidatus Wildermuthbacteria bacterium]|nr:hypothetical protein [Candidatus Wildermuthbacteria bacterium]